MPKTAAASIAASTPSLFRTPLVFRLHEML
jgi:hypothetical protein